MESRERTGTFCSSAEALFRHQVVSLVRSWMLCGEPKAAAVRRASSMPHPTFSGEPRRVSRRTVYRWLEAFEGGGTSGLEPAERASGSASTVLSGDLLDFITAQKADDPAASFLGRVPSKTRTIRTPRRWANRETRSTRRRRAAPSSISDTGGVNHRANATLYASTRYTSPKPLRPMAGVFPRVSLTGVGIGPGRCRFSHPLGIIVMQPSGQTSAHNPHP